MAQKFVGLDDAATELGISKDRLNELREAGKVRAYRDGTSWKFRSEDIEKLVADGLPALDAGGSDLSLDTGSSLGLDSGSDDKTAAAAAAAATSDIDFSLGDDEDAAPAASDISLDELDEPTLPVEGTGDDGQIALAAEDDADDLSDSILLSETELGESTDRPPSTIIGKAEMSSELDLQLAASDSDATAQSDVRLASSTSDVHSPGSPSDAVLDAEPPSLSDNFGDLDELEIDLEAESSRILTPEDVSKAKSAAKSAPASPETSDLELAPSDSDPQVGASSAGGGVLDSSAGASSGGLTGLSALELEGDDDEVLGDGSDITLSSESSGINIISPSDSGLALDEVPLDLSPMAMGSSLDLGDASDQKSGLEPLEVADEETDEGEEPFTLTPFGEDAEEEEEDSSQVIPLDEVSEDDAAGALLGVPAGEGDALTEDFAMAGLPAGAMSVSESGTETPFPLWIMILLGTCMLILPLCGIMMVDLLRNMWSWSEPYTLNSTIMDSISSVL